MIKRSPVKYGTPTSLVPTFTKADGVMMLKTVANPVNGNKNPSAYTQNEGNEVTDNEETVPPITPKVQTTRIPLRCWNWEKCI